MTDRWTDQQRQLITDMIATETENSRLAHKLIPEFMLADPRARTVPADTYNYPAAKGRAGTIDDTTQLKVVEPSVPFVLTKLQAEDEDLSRALMAARRAAQQLARLHDDSVFQVAIRNPINGGGPAFHPVGVVNQVGGSYGEGMVPATAAAVALLDADGYRTGFVMVAGQTVYEELHSRAAGAADLPAKSVQALLDGGPIHRSAVLAADEALVLSVASGQIDRAVSVDPTFEFLRIGANDQRELRIYERFVTRFKETRSAVLLRLAPVVVVKKGP